VSSLRSGTEKITSSPGIRSGDKEMVSMIRW
jgi:hypothetical protein